MNVVRSAEETALLLAVIFKRSGLHRARVSRKTIYLLAGRKHLRGAFLALVIDTLAEYDICLIEIDGGHALIRTKALEAAKPITAKRLLSDEERKAIKLGNSLDLSALKKEIADDDESPDDGE